MVTNLYCRKCAADLPPAALFCPLCGIRQAIPLHKGRTRSNGSGTAYKRGQTWTASVVKSWKTIERNGKPRRVPIRKTKGGFLTKRDALVHCAEILAGRSSNQADPLSEYWKLYSTGKMLQLSENTQGAYKIAYNKLGPLHNKPINQISLKEMQNLITTERPSFDMAKDARSLLSNLFKLAMYDGAIAVNPAQAIVLPDSNYKEGVPFTQEEVKAMWKIYSDGNEFSAYILLMIYTGMMPLELTKLKQDNIDWINKVIVGIGVKTKKRKVTPIVLADVIIPVLADLCEKAETESLLNVSEGKFYRAFYATLKAAGCRDGLTPYSCRHTTATALDLYTSASPAVIADVMRQKTLTMQQNYKHPATQNALDAVNQIQFK